MPCKDSLFQQVKVLLRQRSSQPGSYPRGRGGNEAVEAWEKGGDRRSSASWQAVNDTISDILVRKSLLKRLPRANLIKYVEDRVKPAVLQPEFLFELRDLSACFRQLGSKTNVRLAALGRASARRDTEART